MQVLICNTSQPTLRAEIWGWGCEDSNLYNPDKPIGLSPSWHPGRPHPTPKTVLQALAEGWKLLGPPRRDPTEGGGEESWVWWLTRH